MTSIPHVHVRRTRAARAAAWTAALFALGCTNLGDIGLAECGNAIVEAEAGEDCDSFDEGGSCRPPGEVGECRFDCSPGDDGRPRACPAGFGCGRDAICRQHTGTFSPAPGPDTGPTVRLMTGDFDGNRFPELVAAGQSGLSLHYFDQTGGVAQSTELGFPPTVPAVGQLTDDDAHELAVVTDGVSVFRGKPNRSLLPTSYSPFEIGELTDVQAILMDAMPASSSAELRQFSGDEILFVSGSNLLETSAAGVGQVVGLPIPVTDLAGPIQVGNFVEDPQASPCQELVVAPRAQNWIWIYSPCHWNGTSYRWNQTPDGSRPVNDLPLVQLPAGARITERVLVTDTNGDGHEDLVIATEPTRPCIAPTPADLYVAFGVGDGTFHSGAVVPTAGPGDNGALRIADDFGCTMPLAIADLNLDGLGDIVTRSGIIFSRGGPDGSPNPFRADRYELTTVNLGTPWEAAVVADFNGNGLPDVATVSADSTIEFFNGTGTSLMNRFEIPTTGQPTDLSIGDYDGDLVLDLAFRILGPRGDVPEGAQTGDEVVIAFGRPFGAPSAPVSMGRLGSIEQIESGIVPSFGLDRIDDLVVVSRSEQTQIASVAVLVGSSDRQLVSPFFLSSDGEESLPVRVAIGQFDGDDGGHGDLAVLSDGDGLQDTIIPVPVAGDQRLWLLPSTGEAALDVGTVTRSAPIPDAIDAQRALMAAVDLDGDGTEEIVLLGAGAAEGKFGTMLTARSEKTSDGRAWTIGPVLRVEELYILQEQGPIAGRDAPGGGLDLGELDFYNGHIEVGDLDGDGLDDVVALGVLIDIETRTAQTRVVAFRNSGTGELRPSDRTVLEHPADLFPMGFTLANVDADEDLEVVVSSLDAAWATDVDFDAGALVNAAPLDGIRGGLSIVGGDFNGDGVNDLAVSALDSPTLFFGRPIIE